MGGQPVKKLLVSTWGLCTLQVEVIFLHIGTKISLNRKGHGTFAVFLLSFFIGMCRRAVSAVGCRSPPIQSGLLHFKNSDWRKKEWHTTTDGRTGNGLSGKKPRKKY